MALPPSDFMQGVTENAVRTAVLGALAVLIEVVQRLRAAVRSLDLVARLSSDAFVVLLDRMDPREGLERVRHQLEALLKEPLEALRPDAPAFAQRRQSDPKG